MRRGSTWRAQVVALFTALVMAPSSRAQEAQAPQLKEGDSWSYVVRDAFTGVEQSTESVRVTAVDADGYRLEWTLAAGSRTQELTLGLNVRQRIDGVAGDSGELDFPLKVGKKWHSLTWFDNPNGVSGVLDLEREVVAVEKVKVGAGEFETFKIVAKGAWMAREDRMKIIISDRQGRFELIEWYAPVVKRYVARETNSYAKGHVGSRVRRELVRFDLH